MGLSSIREAWRKPWTLAGRLQYEPTRQAALQKVLGRRRIADDHAFIILGGAFAWENKAAVIAKIAANNDFTSRRTESFDGQHYSPAIYSWDSHLPFLFRWLGGQPGNIVAEVQLLWGRHKQRTEPDERYEQNGFTFVNEQNYALSLGQATGAELMLWQYHAPVPAREGPSAALNFDHEAPFVHETIVHGCYVQGRPFYF